MYKDVSLVVTICAAIALMSLHAGDANAQVTADATLGKPFGVGRITVEVSDEDARELFRTNGFAIEEADGRVFYPAFSNTVLRGLVEEDTRDKLTVSFLFRGSEPLKLTVFTPLPLQITIVPRARRPLISNRQFEQWWRQYNITARRTALGHDYPSLVHSYLTGMLGNRLGLRPPLLSRVQERKQTTEFQKTIELLTASEQAQAGLVWPTYDSAVRSRPASLPMPTDIAWGSPQLPDFDEQPIEPIAMRVPEECFYIRFGSFGNYVWFTRLMREYGGDLAQMVTLRGHDPGLNQKLQRQLAVRESALGELLGGAIVRDMAIIGRDLCIQDGAAIGLLFHAKNNLALNANFTQYRASMFAANQERGAKLETIELAGEKVSFLSTPDNHLRSFYVVDGDFHLVTSSREVARRFIETKNSERSLGASAEFRHARSIMPTAREDTIFVYFSTAFMRGLVSPHYQVELRRRLQATADLQVLQLAILAARSERQAAETIAELIAGKFLPRGFGRRADTSTLLIQNEVVVDSLRGERGSFTPIPDIEITSVTEAEADYCAGQNDYYVEHWKQMDPLMIGVKRFALQEPSRERIVIDANISPIAEEKYGWLLSMLGPSTDMKIATPKDELISVQASVRGGLLAPDIPPHQLFAGIRDVPVETRLQPNGFFKALFLLRETPGYLGSWPKIGVLDWLPVELNGSKPGADGFSQLPLGLSRWQDEGFSVLSFHRDVLDATVDQLRAEPNDDAAQLRLHVGDLSESQLSDWLNFLSHERATQTSTGNAKLLHTLSQQFAIPREAALNTAERLLNTTLVCSLEGKYELSKADRGMPVWRSTNWSKPGEPLPTDYEAPWTSWFRGLELALAKNRDRLVIHAELDVQRTASDMKLKLPMFDLFRRTGTNPGDRDPFD